MLVAKTFLSNTFLAVFAFVIAKMITQGQQLVKPVIYMCFCFVTCENHIAEVAASLILARSLLSNIFLAVFAFLIAKMIILGYQLVKPIIYTYFFFLPDKNCDMKAAIQRARQASCTVKNICFLTQNDY